VSFVLVVGCFPLTIPSPWLAKFSGACPILCFLITSLTAPSILLPNRINKKSNLKGQTQKISISLDESDDEGLALLIPDIQETAALVQSATYSDANSKDEHDQSISLNEYPMGSSIEQKYLEVMKRLQFGEFRLFFWFAGDV
jgi:hypothetical protein